MQTYEMPSLINLNRLAEQLHAANVKAGWWNDPETGESLKEGPIAKYVDFTKLSLVHSEVSEMVEGIRKNLQDDHLPHRPMGEVECADAIIRLLDFCGKQGYDIHGALFEKWKYNKTRADHKTENRGKEGGKTV